MNQINVQLLDLPNEILLIILKKLDNIDVLYSLFGINNKRLNFLIQGGTFTNTLKFVSTSLTDNVCSIPVPVLNQFCTNILPNIDHRVKYLVLEPLSMENILLAANYPNLTELKIFNFNKNIVSDYFTNNSPFRRIFKEQITSLILVRNEGTEGIRMRDYTTNVYAHILTFFEHLKYLNFAKLTSAGYPSLSLWDLPSTICSSSTLTKLCIEVNSFEDCLSLLDGRLKQLDTFIVQINDIHDHSSIVSNTNDLPNLKCFSLTCIDVTYEYDNQIVPLLRRMSHLEELTLYLWINKRSKFVDGTHLHNEILVHMPRLHTFIFYISTRTTINDSIGYLSNDDIERTFIKIGFKQVNCIVDYINTCKPLCHVFSLPFAFNRLERIGNHFPNITFNNVTYLWVCDTIPFKHEFFVRIAQAFPFLRKLKAMNITSQSSNRDELESNVDQSYSVVEYSHLTSLDVMYANIDYIEQFLLQTKTSLPQLTELKVRYNKLKIVTENFTREATRLNCIKVKRIIIEKTTAHPEEFYLYFPLVTSVLFCFD